jgi:hypothetical protein
MNLLAHAEVIRRLGYRQPQHVVGAMLPDLAGMARFRIPPLPPGPLADGVAMHHRTDEVFHGSPRFQSWCAQATHHLTEAGMARGAARASAHLGVELLIDGELVRITDVADAVEGAMAASRAEVMALVTDPTIRAGVDQMLGWITDGGLRTAYEDPEAVSWRIERILSHRPRLALGIDGRERCQRELQLLDELVTPLVPTVIEEAVEPLRPAG